MFDVDFAVKDALKIAHAGSIRHHGAGRTDDTNMHVAGESFVVPADVVSALGEGNTEAGFRVLERMFPPPQIAKAEGGEVPIVAAGGEFVVHPFHVKRIGGGDLKKGHDRLRDFVTLKRKKTISALKKLPKPARG